MPGIGYLEESLFRDSSPQQIKGFEFTGPQAMQTTKFVELLEMLQQEHHNELNSLRDELEGKLQAMQQDLLDARSLSESHVQKAMNEAVQQRPPDSSYKIACIDTGQHCSEHAATVSLDPSTCAAASKDQQDELNSAQDQQDELNSAQSQFESQVSQGPFSQDYENFKTHVGEELDELRKFVTTRSSWRGVVKWDDTHLPTWRQKLVELVGWQWFDVVCAFAIISNAVLMGLQIDHTARNASDPFDGPVIYRVMDRIYTIWFVCELLIKLLAFGTTFFYRPEWPWNVFDFIVVSTDAVQTVAELATLEDGNALGNFTALRMLRVLRVTRAIRVVRLVRFFRELRMMVYSVMKCGTSLMWSMLMFFMIIYIFGIFLMNAVALYVYDNTMSGQDYQHYRDRWGSLPRGMWTLFACMSGGVSWLEVGNPLQNISWVYAGTLGFFEFFTIFVVTNIITGIFVDTAIQSAQRDRDEVIQEQLADRDSARSELQQVFEEADNDHSGTLTMEEFVTHLRSEKVRAHLKSVGLHVDEALSLFKLLDINQTNAIGIEEFLFGCMRLKGGATSIDLATLMYENKRMVDGLKKFHDDTRSSLQLILAKVSNQELVAGVAPGIQRKLQTAPTQPVLAFI